MLSPVSKTAFLYVQDYHDPVAAEAVNDLEDLTSGLSGKMWQKITMLPSQRPVLSPTSGPQIRSDRPPRDGRQDS